MAKPNCHVCGGQAEEVQALFNEAGTNYRAAHRVVCARCGTYDITLMLASMLDKPGNSMLNDEERYHLSGITRMATERTDVEELTSQSLADLLDTTPSPSPVEQAELLLQHLAKRYKPAGKPVPLDPTNDYPLVGALGPDAFKYVIRSLVEQGLTEPADTHPIPSYRVSMNGFERLRQPRGQHRASTPSLDPAQQTDDHAALGTMIAGDPSWQRVKRELARAGEAVGSAEHEEDHQVVGQLCTQALITLAQASIARRNTRRSMKSQRVTRTRSGCSRHISPLRYTGPETRKFAGRFGRL